MPAGMALDFSFIGAFLAEIRNWTVEILISAAVIVVVLIAATLIEASAASKTDSSLY